jgi:hypothetical protein
MKFLGIIFGVILNIIVEPLTLQIFVRSWRKNWIVCQLFTATKEYHDLGRRGILYCVCVPVSLAPHYLTVKWELAECGMRGIHQTEISFVLF